MRGGRWVFVIPLAVAVALAVVVVATPAGAWRDAACGGVLLCGAVLLLGGRG